jgi:cell wall-associated NlpC family hydrolase
MLVGTAVAFCVGLLPATHAYAEPTQQEVEAQIEKTWSQLEPLIEQYNNTHNQLKKNQQKSTDLAKRIQPLQLQVDLALNQVGAIATQYYKGGGQNSTLVAILNSGSPTSLAEQLSLLNQLAKSRQEQISTVRTARDQFAGEKKQLDDLIALQAKQDADLAAKKKTIEAEMSRLQQLRLKYGISPNGSNLLIGACPAVYIGGAAGTAARYACAHIGKPYVWGAIGPNSFDCSGLTMASWAAAGVRLTHYTGAQWREGTPVSAADARPGDLVFFYSDQHHVGLYVGNGLMVHAPTSGDYVRMAYVNKMPVAGYRRPG